MTYSSPGIGTTPHLSGELFKRMAGIELIHVPYRGIEALNSAPHGDIALTEALESATNVSILLYSAQPGATPMAGTIPGQRG